MASPAICRLSAPPSGPRRVVDGQTVQVYLTEAEESAIIVEQDKLETQEAQDKINAEARAYLASTDWYIIRKQETGEEIPQEVLNARAEARAKVV